MRFSHRAYAGRMLGEVIRPTSPDALVLALPRGGVPVGHEVARAHRLELDVWSVRKLAVPGHPGRSLGAIAESGEFHVDEEAVARFGITEKALEQTIAVEAAEVVRRTNHFRRGRPKPLITGREVFLVDDGIDTGGTMLAALRAVRRLGPLRIVIAVPIAPQAALHLLAEECDGQVCILQPQTLGALSQWYDDFCQVSEEEALDILARPHVQGSVAPARAGFAFGDA